MGSTSMVSATCSCAGLYLDYFTTGLRDRATIVSTLDDSVICPEDQFASIADTPAAGNTSRTTSSNEETQLPYTVDDATTDSKVSCY